MRIGFNKPYFSGKEFEYIRQAIDAQKISGDGLFTKKCHDFFEKRYNFKKVFLTTSCSDALEMAAILIDIQPGDEVIMPSYTFVSTANAFILRGAKIVFADSEPHHPNIDAEKIESLITAKTKAIVPVHYAGMACDMNKIMSIARKYNLFVIEDAAQAIDSYYDSTPLGGFGHLAAFSFHESKNIISGEGGMLVVNDDRFVKRAEIIREKGTDRAAFFRGEIDKYGWVDIGSSFLPSDILAAFLFAQLENLDAIQRKRLSIWKKYHEALQMAAESGNIILPSIPRMATNNAHMYYIICKSLAQRTQLVHLLQKKNIYAVFHYQSLHKSRFFEKQHDGRSLANSDRFTDCLLRLPMYYELTDEDIVAVTDEIVRFSRLPVVHNL